MIGLFLVFFCIDLIFIILIYLKNKEFFILSFYLFRSIMNIDIIRENIKLFFLYCYEFSLEEG